MPEVDLRYPKAKYHAKLPVALVANAREESDLGEGWFDHPSLKNKPIFLQSGDVVEAAELLEIEAKPVAKPVGRPRKSDTVETA